MNFIAGSVREVLSEYITLFLRTGGHLAADPMGGRRARPFPYLTLIIEKEKKATSADWYRITDYSILDEQRQYMYINNTESMNDDFRKLDCSLTLKALDII